MKERKLSLCLLVCVCVSGVCSLTLARYGTASEVKERRRRGRDELADGGEGGKPNEGYDEGREFSILAPFPGERTNLILLGRKREREKPKRWGNAGNYGTPG